MKHLLTLSLMVALIALPFESNQAQQQPQPKFTLLELCIVVPVLGLATVAVICYVWHEHTQPWPTNSNQWSNSVPVQPDPPQTNEFGVFTNNFASAKVYLLSGPPIAAMDISSQGCCDTNATLRGGGIAVMFTNLFQFTLKAGPSPDQLTPLYIVKGWLSAGGRLIEYEDPQGHYLSSSYAFWGSYPQAPPIGTGLERARFMTFVSP